MGAKKDLSITFDSTYFGVASFPFLLRLFFFSDIVLAVSTFLFALLLHQGKEKVG